MTSTIRLLIYATSVSFLFAGQLSAQEEVRTRATEGATFTLNKNGSVIQSVTITEYNCQECEPVTLTIDSNTQLLDSEGREQPIELLAETFIRSAGFKYRTPDNIAIKISLHSIEEAIQ